MRHATPSRRTRPRPASRTGVWVALVVGVLGFVACDRPAPDAPDTPGGHTRHADDAGRFSIAFPDGWAVQRNAFGAALLATEPLQDDRDAFAENVNVLVEAVPAGLSIDDYLDAGVAHLARLATDYHELDRREAALPAGRARYLEFQHRMGQVSLHAGQYYLVRGESAFVVTCTAEPGEFQRCRETFERIAETLRLGE